MWVFIGRSIVFSWAHRTQCVFPDSYTHWHRSLYSAHYSFSLLLSTLFFPLSFHCYILCSLFFLLHVLAMPLAILLHLTCSTPLAYCHHLEPWFSITALLHFFCSPLTHNLPCLLPHHSTPSRSLQSISVSYCASLLVFPLLQWNGKPPHPHWWSADGASRRAVPHAGQSTCAFKWARMFLKTRFIYFLLFWIINCWISSPVLRRPAWALLTLLLQRWSTQAPAASEVSWTRVNSILINKILACKSEQLVKAGKGQYLLQSKYRAGINSIICINTMEYVFE